MRPLVGVHSKARDRIAVQLSQFVAQGNPPTLRAAFAYVIATLCCTQVLQLVLIIRACGHSSVRVHNVANAAPLDTLRLSGLCCRRSSKRDSCASQRL